MKIEYTTLYQPEEVLERCLPEGVDAVSAFIDTIRSTLTQPEFESPPAAERAIVIAIHSSGAVRGWACARSEVALEREQALLDAFLKTVTPPLVASGVFIIALVYATAARDLPPADEAWIPQPLAWQQIAEALPEPVELEVLVSRFFEA
jgi:hypothetical protein